MTVCCCDRDERHSVLLEQEVDALCVDEHGNTPLVGTSSWSSASLLVNILPHSVVCVASVTCIVIFIGLLQLMNISSMFSVSEIIVK